MTTKRATLPLDLYLEICTEVFEEPPPEVPIASKKEDPERGVEVDVTGCFLLDFTI